MMSIYVHTMLSNHDALQKLTQNNIHFSSSFFHKDTNRHFRTMIRLISNNILTYTEMVAADELVGASRNRNVQHQLLGQSVIIPEGPSVLQLGGNDISQLYNSAKLYNAYSKNQRKRSKAKWKDWVEEAGKGRTAEEHNAEQSD